jgi:hypothetical protein
MLYVVLFEDNLDLGTDVRGQHMPAHLSFLEKKRGVHRSGRTVGTHVGSSVTLP